MIRQLNSKNIKTENQSQVSQIKNQTISRNITKTMPAETLSTFQKTPSIINQIFQKSQSQLDKGKPFSRTSKLPQKIEIKQDPVVQQNKIISRKPRLKTLPNEELLLSSRVQPTPKAKFQLKFMNTGSQQNIQSAQQQTKKIQLKIDVKAFNTKTKSLTTRQITKNEPTQSKLMINPKQLKRITTAHAKILFFSASQTYRRVVLTLQKMAFNNIKMISLKLQRQTFSIANQSLKLNVKKCKQGITNFLHILYRNKLKQSWNILRNNKIRKQLYEKNVGNVFSLFGNVKFKRNLKYFFQLMKIKANRRIDLLDSFSLAFNFCNKDKKIVAFQKIYNTYASSKSTQTPQNKNLAKNDPIKQPNNKIQTQVSSRVTSTKNLPINNSSADLNKKEKAQQQINLRNQQISALQDSIKNKKRNLQTQSKKLKKKIQDLEKQKLQNTKQLNQNNIKKQKIINQIQKYNKNKIRAQNIAQDSKNSTQLFKFIQSIYILVQRIQKNQNLAVIIDQILRQNILLTHKIPKNIIEQWLNIQKRIQLQKQIGRYEKSIIGNKDNQFINNHYSYVNEQSNLVVQMTRNFIKQRYFWREIQNFVATIM